MATLIQDLEDLTQVYELAPMVRDRLRVHARRLRELMEADMRRNVTLVRELLEHINGGPLK